MAVNRGAAMARRMFYDRQTAAGEMTLNRRAQRLSRSHPPCAKAAILQERMGVDRRDIAARRAIDVDADTAQFARDQRVTQIKTARIAKGRLVQWRHPFAPMRRAETLDPSALLIDQHRRIASDRRHAGRGSGGAVAQGSRHCGQRG